MSSHNLQPYGNDMWSWTPPANRWTDGGGNVRLTPASIALWHGTSNVERAQTMHTAPHTYTAHVEAMTRAWDL